MTKIESIEKEIRALTETELAAFRKWFLEFDAETWDRQIERDSVSGRLANLAKKSIEDHDSGESTVIDPIARKAVAIVFANFVKLSGQSCFDAARLCT